MSRKGRADDRGSRGASASQTIKSADLKKIFAAVKSGKINNIIKFVQRFGVASLSQPLTSGGECPWEIAIKKRQFHTIIKTLVGDELMDKEQAVKLASLYLTERARTTRNPSLSDDSPCIKDEISKFIADDEFLEEFMRASAGSLISSMGFEKIIFSHLARNDKRNVRHCLQQNSNFNRLKNEAGNLAHNAARTLRTSGMIAVLKEGGVDLNYKHNGATPIFAAISQDGNFEVLRDLVEHGADVNIPLETDSLVNESASASADINENSISAMEFCVLSALDNTIAQRENYIKCFQFLKEYGCKVDYAHLMHHIIRNNTVYAIRNLNDLSEIMGDDIDLIGLLNTLELNVNGNRLSVVQSAAYYVRLEILKVFIEEFLLSVNLTGSDYRTAIVFALIRQEEEIVMYLLDNHVDFLADMEDGLYLLHFFFQRGYRGRGGSSFPISVIQKVLEVIPDRKKLLNMEGHIMTSSGTPSSQTFAPIEMAIMCGDEELTELLLQDSDVDAASVQESLYYLAAQYDQCRLIPLLQKYEVPLTARTLYNFRILDDRKQNRFLQNYVFPTLPPLLQADHFETLYEDYQKCLAYYQMIAVSNSTFGKELSAHVIASFERFLKENGNDFLKLFEAQKAFYIDSTEVKVWLEFVYRRCLVHGFLGHSEEEFLRHQLIGWFEESLAQVKELFDYGKTVATEASGKFTMDDAMPRPQAAMSALAFLQQEKGLTLEAAKQYIRDSKTISPADNSASLWDASVTSERVDEVVPSWFEGLLSSEDERVRNFENNPFCHILITDGINLDGPFKESLMGKSRWIFAPTNAVKKIQGNYPVELQVDKQLFHVKFTHEICATATADRVLCCSIKDEQTGRVLIIPGYYCVGGLHVDNKTLPDKIDLHLLQSLDCHM